MTVTYTPRMGRTKKIKLVVKCTVTYMPEKDVYGVFGLRHTPGGKERQFYHYSEIEPSMFEELPCA